MQNEHPICYTINLARQFLFFNLKHNFEGFGSYPVVFRVTLGSTFRTSVSTQGTIQDTKDHPGLVKCKARALSTFSDPIQLFNFQFNRRRPLQLCWGYQSYTWQNVGSHRSRNHIYNGSLHVVVMCSSPLSYFPVPFIYLLIGLLGVKPESAVYKVAYPLYYLSEHYFTFVYI